MLKFLFDRNTANEREDTNKLYGNLQSLENEIALGEPERNEDVADVLVALIEEYDLSLSSPVYNDLSNLLCVVANESDLYTNLDVATDAFIGDLVMDAENRARMVRKIALYTNHKSSRELAKATMRSLATVLLDALPDGMLETEAHGSQVFDVRLLDVLSQAPEVVTHTLAVFDTTELLNTALFHSLRTKLQQNGEYIHEHVKKNALPEDLGKDHDITQVIHLFLRNTCLESFFSLTVPLVIPQSVRFEHMHIVAGSGHGKTQTLQYLISRDIPKVQVGEMGFAVIDSQGDLINRILERKIIGEMQDRVLLIDPNDIAYPPALNMFDIGLSHSENVDPVVREKIINGTIDLYTYIFSSLLGAELTQKQGVIFTYLARMMMVIPGANIHTLRELIEDGNQFRQYFDQLDPSTRHFFETQFFTKAFTGTRQQVLTRLWGVLSNQIFERMFSSNENKVDIFEAMNEGKIVLINTAKDLLKSDGCSIFGRFFIALIAQAALSRSMLPIEARKPFMVYIDEAHDYFDERIEDIANQARKFNVGMILSHQNLDQANAKLRASIMSSTSIKFAGGVSAKDAQVLAQNMQTKPEVILSARKRKKETQFACFVRNLTPQPVVVSVPFGVLESMPETTKSDRDAMLEENRSRVSIVEPELVESVTDPQEVDEASPTRAEPEVSEKAKVERGKGGAKHKAIQKRLSDAAIAQGISAHIEEYIDDGKHIDLVFYAGKRRVACEISVSTSVAHELSNVDKCIDAEFGEVWVVSESTSWIGSFRASLTDTEKNQVVVKILTVDEALKCIENMSIDKPESFIGGRHASSVTKEITDDEKERREIVLAKLIQPSFSR